MIGKTVPIKFLDHPTAEKSFAERVQNNQPLKPWELWALNGVDAKDLMKGDPKAVYDSFKSGVEVFSTALNNKQITGNLI